MPKHRHRPAPIQRLPRLIVPVSLGAALVLCAVGFVYFTRIALDKQAHFAPDSVHPYDGYAVGCLFLGLIALGGLFIHMPDPPRRPWRKARRIPAGRAAKPRRHFRVQ